ncbi:MAG: flagellar biosynthetic protein FliO [Acidobacteriota bacterium]
MLRVITGIKNLLAHAQGIRCKRKDRVMHLCETLSLGDRRFLALVRVGEQKFLVGAAGGSVSLLTQIPSRQEPESHGRQAEDVALFGIKDYKTWS